MTTLVNLKKSQQKISTREQLRERCALINEDLDRAWQEIFDVVVSLHIAQPLKLHVTTVERFNLAITSLTEARALVDFAQYPEIDEGRVKQ